MINDNQTNMLYLADTLPSMYPAFFKEFEKLLVKHKIKFALLPFTNDVWARDYMPIQNGPKWFVQFIYDPDYLKTNADRKTISDTVSICKSLKIKPFKSNLKVDGGNVIHFKEKAILCDKVLKENKHLTKKQITTILASALQTPEIIYIPTPKDDIFGHSDGTVRFINSKTVLVNQYSNIDKDYKAQLHQALKAAKLKYKKIPYNPYGNKNILSANGVYMNYLEMKKFIFLPQFGLKEDKIALQTFKDIFKTKTIIPVNCKDIAKDGGVLNCISWNIFVTKNPDSTIGIYKPKTPKWVIEMYDHY
jgi:agmatine deiminase